MKKLILYLFFVTAYCAHAKTISVCKSCRSQSISDAIAKANAFDSIIIEPGTYKEGNILIEKPLVLLGQNLPVIDGEGKHEMFTVKSDNVIISGFKLISSGQSSLSDLAAVKVYNAKRVSVLNNILLNNYFGIYLANCNNCLIANNKIEGEGITQQASGNGIHLWKCNNVKISSNYIKAHRDGIYFEFVTESFITKNISESNLRYGLHFMFSDSDTYEENTFRNNGAGVAVMYTKNVKMYRNTFEFNWSSGAYGILLKDIRDSEIIGNILKGNTTGIYAESASRITISKNIFSENGWALRITSSCDGINITINDFLGNTFDMATSSVSNVTLNTYNGNYWDKYEGYDLNKDKKGDIPYYPVSLSTMLVEKIPSSALFLHSFVLDLINKSEKLVPQLIPEGIRDNMPSMKRVTL